MQCHPLHVQGSMAYATEVYPTETHTQTHRKENDTWYSPTPPASVTSRDDLTIRWYKCPITHCPYKKLSLSTNVTRKIIFAFRSTPSFTLVVHTSSQIHRTFLYDAHHASCYTSPLHRTHNRRFIRTRSLYVIDADVCAHGPYGFEQLWRLEWLAFNTYNTLKVGSLWL
jgi:hypothetical protein